MLSASPFQPTTFQPVQIIPQLTRRNSKVPALISSKWRYQICMLFLNIFQQFLNPITTTYTIYSLSYSSFTPKHLFSMIVRDVERCVETFLPSNYPAPCQISNFEHAKHLLLLSTGILSYIFLSLLYSAKKRYHLVRKSQNRCGGVGGESPLFQTHPNVSKLDAFQGQLYEKVATPGPPIF